MSLKICICAEETEFEKNKFLQDDKLPTNKITNEKDSFVFEQSIFREALIIFNLSIQIGFSIVFEVGIQTVSTVYLGHLPNSSQILSSTGLAVSFANMTAIGVSWGFASGLWTLIPQAVGSNRTDLIALYVQRAVVVCLLIELPLSLLLFFGGNLLCFIGSPADLCADLSINIINNYCRALLPFPYFMVLLAILQRIGQSLNYNCELNIIVGLNFLLSMPLTYIFVDYFGYIGCAIMLDILMLNNVILTAGMLMYKGYLFVFKPLPFNKVCTKDGLYEYYSLSWPGAIQISLRWISREAIAILSGFVFNPKIAVATSIVMIQLNTIRLLHIGVANGSGIRIGKYIGASSIVYAKRCIKIQILYEMFLTIMTCIIFISCKDIIPRIFTDDKEIISMVSSLIYAVLFYQVLVAIFQNVSAIFRALGYQRLSAYIIPITYYLIALPILIYLLFSESFHYHTNIYGGVSVIWFGSGFGYLLGNIIIVFMLLYYVDWNKAVNESQMRITLNNKPIVYGSTSLQSTVSNASNKQTASEK